MLRETEHTQNNGKYRQVVDNLAPALMHRAAARRAFARRRERSQTACKPGSVPAGAGDDHSSGPAIADRFSRPTRTPRAVNPAAEAARRPYSVLLQAGLAMPAALPGPRWALTPPFHPYRPREAGGLLSVALSLGSPRAEVIRRHFTVEPGLSSTGRAPPRPPGRLTGNRWACGEARSTGISPAPRSRSPRRPAGARPSASRGFRRRRRRRPCPGASGAGRPRR